jgi:hypothetical protein
LRFLLVEAAQVTVRSIPEWRSKYFHLTMRGTEDREGSPGAQTGRSPAGYNRLQAIHDSRQIFDEGQVAPGQLAQHAHAHLAMVDRLEIIEA